MQQTKKLPKYHAQDAKLKGFALKFSVIATLSSILALSMSSRANAYDSWFGGNQDSVNWTQTFDRSAAREWEMNPPKGFPTLDKGNLPLMKQAVKRYAAIVSAGGGAKFLKAKWARVIVDRM